MSINSFRCCDIQQGQAVITTCAVCVGVTLWLLRGRWQRRQLFKNGIMGSGDADANDAANDDNDVKCNDPNCLRCHSSTSQHHIHAFHYNVILLRRLVKLEPQLFDGMREEIWSVLQDKRNLSSSTAMLQQHQENGRVMSFFSGQYNNNLMVRFWTWTMRALSSSSFSHPSPSSFSTTTQAGQNPTVFFLPGLETTPLHDENQCPAGHNCPCLRLWKTDITEKSHDEHEIIRSKKLRPIMSMTGDIHALQNGFNIIRRELMQFLSCNGSATTTNNKNSERSYNDPSSEDDRACFQPFDPKVYTHASSICNSDENGNVSRISSDCGQDGQQQQQPKPEWSSIYLYHRGLRQSNKICDKYFPQTMHILETQCPHRMAGKCGLGSVYFSKLGRNTKVKEHCGPTNVRWRCHLPLIVPQSRSSFLRVGLARVNEQSVGWEEGKPILFDDSFLHSAVHYGGDTNNATTNDNLGGARIVLIVDFWHPSLSEMDRTALGVLYPPGS